MHVSAMFFFFFVMGFSLNAWLAVGISIKLNS
jgi:hypothetical protein